MLKFSHQNTSTSLNFYLAKANRTLLNNETRDELILLAFDLLEEDIFAEVLKNESMIYEESKYRNWYAGYTSPSLPYFKGISRNTVPRSMAYTLFTSATSGEIITPRFKSAFHQDWLNYEMTFYIYLPESIKKKPKTKVIFRMEFDVKENKGGKDEIFYPSSRPKRINFENIKKIRKIQTFRFPLSKLQSQTYRKFEYRRYLDNIDVTLWKAKRETGMKLTWYYEEDGKIIRPDPDKIGDKRGPTYQSIGSARNQEFVRLTNVLYQLSKKDISIDQLWIQLKRVRIQEVDDSVIECEAINDVDGPRMLKSEKIVKQLTDIENYFGLISDAEPTYLEQIDNSTLTLGAEMYIYLLFCPTSEMNIFRNYYDSLFKYEPLQDIVTSLVNERAILTNHQSAGKVKVTEKLIEKILQSVSIHSPKTNLGFSHKQKISNHPVHIVDEAGKFSPSAFIPFCKFGGSFLSMGKHIPEFSTPVCIKFKPTILIDQLCYSADVNDVLNSLGDTHKDEAVKRGLTFLMDYNTERYPIESTERSVLASFFSLVKNEEINAFKAGEAKVYIGTIGDTKCKM